MFNCKLFFFVQLQHSSVSKVGKAIDRSFVSDYDSTSREEVFETKQSQAMVNEIILQVLIKNVYICLISAFPVKFILLDFSIYV